MYNSLVTNHPLILTGVGSFTSVKDTSMSVERSLAFIERHVTHPELYQDIVLRLRPITINNGQFTIPEDEMAFAFELYDTHRVLTISVHRMVKFPARRQHIGTMARFLHLKVTGDGLIADIIDSTRSMNPVNARPVWDGACM